MAYDKKKKNAIYDKTNGYCHLCGKKLSRNNYNLKGSKGAWHIDHSKPKANLGTDHMNNLFAACIICNSEKGTLHKNTIRKRKGYYEKNSKKDTGCFLTTACVVNKGLPDDCYELQTLRLFRDNYVSKLSKGKQLIDEYYKTAPNIVKNINAQSNSRSIYSSLYKNVIRNSIKFIEAGNNEEALNEYSTAFLQLKEKYSL